MPFHSFNPFSSKLRYTALNTANKVLSPHGNERCVRVKSMAHGRPVIPTDSLIGTIT